MADAGAVSLDLERGEGNSLDLFYVLDATVEELLRGEPAADRIESRYEDCFECPVGHIGIRGDDGSGAVMPGVRDGEAEYFSFFLAPVDCDRYRFGGMAEVFLDGDLPERFHRGYAG